MESSQRSHKADDSPDHRWSGILGTLVALLTLTLPLVMIAHYSPMRSNAQPIPSRLLLERPIFEPMD